MSKSGAIIIVDDDADDANLVRRAVLSLRPQCPVQIIASGMDLKDYLEALGNYSNRQHFPLPVMILLDLRMPEMDGFEVMEWLKRQPPFSDIPVIVISSFDRQKNIRISYLLGARTFLSKPVNPEQVREAVRALKLPIEFLG